MIIRTTTTRNRSSGGLASSISSTKWLRLGLCCWAALPLLGTAARAAAESVPLSTGGSLRQQRRLSSLHSEGSQVEEDRTLSSTDDSSKFGENNNSTAPTTTTTTSNTRRVIINQFDVLLTSSEAAGGPTGILASASSSEGQQQLKALHDAAEVTIRNYIDAAQSTSLVKSILLGAVAVSTATTTGGGGSVDNVTTYPYFETARVSFGKGVVNVASSGSSTSIPTSYEVNLWVQEAINKGLMGALMQESSNATGGFQSDLPIDQVEYVQLVDNPKPPETEPPRNSTTDGIQDGGGGKGGTSQSSSSINLTLLIVLCAVGCAVVVSAVGLIAMRRRNNRMSKGKDPTRYVEQRNPAYSVKEMMDDALDVETTSKDGMDDDPGFGAEVVTSKKNKVKGEESTASNDDLNTTRETIKASSVGSNSPGRQSVVSAASSSAASDTARHNNNSSILSRSGYFSARSGASGSGRRLGSDKGLNETMDGRSVAGESESDFTVNTEAGDSLALQSISGYQPNSSNSNPNASHPGQPHPGQQKLQHMVPAPPFAATESFQRERPVSLQKDMLVSSWSGGSRPVATSGSAGSGGGNLRVSSASPTSSSIRMVPHHHQGFVQQSQSDSVLSPNHFVAAEEKKKTTQQRGGLSGRLSVSTSWGQRRPQPQLEEVANENDDGDDTDYDGSVSVDSLASPSDDDRNRSAAMSSSSSSSFSVPAPPSLLGRRSGGNGRRSSSKSPNAVPQTPPSATSRQRFVGPPRPSPGNVV